jgi:hypothetical protein
VSYTGSWFDVECDPVDLNGKSVSCLLYADDIVLLSQSAQGLQNLLNKLKLFCDKWNYQVLLTDVVIIPR